MTPTFSRLGVVALATLLLGAVAACSAGGSGTGNPNLVGTFVPPAATATPVPTATPIPTTVGAAPFAFTRAPGTFYALGTGPTRPALDVIGADGSYSVGTRNITLKARMAGPIALGAPNYYVWGINRGGAGAAPFPGEPNVIFDAVVVETVNADGTVGVALNTLGTGATSTPLAGTAYSVVNDTITVTFTSALMPTAGFAPNKYTWNLWPRSGVGGAATAQIASFAPENAVLPFVVVP